MKTHDRWDFEDFDEFINICETTKREKGSSSVGSNASWSGTDTYSEAIDLAKNGWQAGRERLALEADKLNPYVLAAQRHQAETLAPAGYAPNVPAYCAGSPASMYCQDPDGFLPSKTPVLRFLVNRSALARVDADNIMNRGAAICALVDYFENINVRVEIDVCMAASGDRDCLHEVHVPVKRADEHMEPDRLAFCLANPAFHRRLGFRLREANAKVFDALGGAYGRSTDIEPEPDQVYFPCLTNNQGIETSEAALETVLERLAEYLEPELRTRVSEDWQEFNTRAAV